MLGARVIMCLAVVAGLAVAARAEIGTNVTGGQSHIVLPSDGDEYAKLVAQAASSDASVDFRALRLAYLSSAARKNSEDPRGLRKPLFEAVQSGDDLQIRAAAEKLITASYIDMFGHKFLRQACEHLHDDACAKEEHFVEFGLLKSIVGSGDGKTCPTGWEVVTVDEEYFVLSMLSVAPKSQALINGPPACDALETTGQSGETQTYFFRIDAVLKDEQAMFEGPRSP
jgi:hypothetical protein